MQLSIIHDGYRCTRSASVVGCSFKPHGRSHGRLIVYSRQTSPESFRETGESKRFLDELQPSKGHRPQKLRDNRQSASSRGEEHARQQRTGQGYRGQRAPARGLWLPPAKTDNPSILRLPITVVVEGPADACAVRRAVHSPVFILGGVRHADYLYDKIQGDAVVLVDSDGEGRRGRRVLAEKLPNLRHAFIPSWLSMAARDTKNHEIGNVGVEHAPPEVILTALKNAKRSTPGKKLFTKDMMQQFDLVSDPHEKDREKANQRRAKREIVCAALGLGSCDGSQLVKTLNRFDFSMEEVQKAVGFATHNMSHTTYDDYKHLMACSIYPPN